MNLTIINKNADFWDYTSDSITPALLIYGYEVYELDSNPGVQSDYIYVIANADGTYKTPTITGYTKIDEIPPHAGFSNTGNKLKWPAGDAGLFALSEAYGLGLYTDVDTPNEVTYAQLMALKYDPLYNLIISDVLNSTPVQDGDNLIFADQSGNGNDLIVTDSYTYSIKADNTVSPKAPNKISFGTEFTWIGWVRQDGYIATSSPFSWVGYLRTYASNVLGFVSGLLWDAGTTPVNTFYPDTWYRLAVTVKSGGNAVLYLNGVAVLTVAANTFDYSATVNQMNFGVYAVKGNWSYADVQAWTKEFSADEILWDYNNRYNLITDKVDTLLTLDDLFLRYKFQEGIFNALDCSGKSNHMVATPTSYTITTDNEVYHGNIVEGCYKVSADSGLTWYYVAFGTYDSYSLNNLFGQYIKRLNPGGFTDCESSIYQKNTGLPDYNNFWYDGGGIANKKVFSDFTEAILNNQLFFDISDPTRIKRALITSIQTESNLPRSLINYGEHTSSDTLVIGDSESTLYNLISMDILELEESGLVANISQGGQHSYQFADGWLIKAVDDGTKRPKDIATQYPDNPEIWTDYTVEQDSYFDTYTADKAWTKSYNVLTIIGTNNPTIPYLTAPDFGEIHYRLLMDNGIIQDRMDNKIFWAMFHLNPDPGYTQYESDYLLYKNYVESIGGVGINPRQILEDCYNSLFNNTIEGNSVLEKANSLPITDTIYAPYGCLRYIDGYWLIWVIRKNTNTDGSMATGNISTFMSLSCDTPNTIVNVDGIDYDIYNPYIGSIELTDGWIPDVPSLFPSSMRNDNIHIHFTARFFVYCHYLNLLSNVVVNEYTLEDRRKDFRIDNETIIKNIVAQPYDGEGNLKTFT